MSSYQQAYSKLEAMIVIGQLAPGSLHTEKELGAMLDLGRTPVREAIQHLAHEGLIEVQPRRGVVIPAISADAQMKLLEVRRVVEQLCVEQACRFASDAQRVRMRDIADNLPVAAENTTDRQGFLLVLRDAHRALIEAADNPYLARAMRPVQGLSRRFWFFYARLDDYEIAARIHADIMRSVAENNKEAGIEASNGLIAYLEAFTQRTITVSPVAS